MFSMYIFPVSTKYMSCVYYLVDTSALYPLNNFVIRRYNEIKLLSLNYNSNSSLIHAFSWIQERYHHGLYFRQQNVLSLILWINSIAYLLGTAQVNCVMEDIFLFMLMDLPINKLFKDGSDGYQAKPILNW